jgi:hypothetical protein
MNQIQQECKVRGITRLCHFTQSRNLAHIFDSPLGLYSTKTLQSLGMPHNPTDPNRYDGRDDLICCSIEYPNTYYFHTVRGHDHLFKDWVVLLIEPDYLWQPDTCFCPCNAARECGNYIQTGFQGFLSLYEDTSPGIKFSRPPSHLSAASTDIQAEVLVKDPIYLDSIIGVVVQSMEQAEQEVFRFNLQGISINKPIYIVPDFFNRSNLSRLIQQGRRTTGILFENGGVYEI